MSRKLILSTVAAALGGLLFGYETAVINGALPFLTDFFNLTDVSKGAAVSAALVGCIVGALIIGRPGDKFGRLFMLKIMAVLYLVSAIGTGLSNGINTLIIFRFIGGIAVGGSSVLSPLYIAEISPAKYRGRLAITFQLAIVIGILVAFFVDYLLIGTGENNWRFMLLSMGIPAIVFFVLLMFVVKSPRWLVKEGRIDEAKEVLNSLNDGADTDEMVKEIAKTLEGGTSVGIAAMLKKGNFRLILIGIAVGMFNQFTGINIIMYYATDIFRSAGFSTDSALGQTVIIGVVNLVFTLVAMRLIDRIGRKRLLLTGTLGMSVFLSLFAFAYINGSLPGWVLMASLVGFIAFFASSQGAVIWVLLAEIYPNHLRSMGTSMGSFSHWFFNGVITFLYPIVIGLFSSGKGTGYIFVFYAAATFFSFFVFRKYLAEMKGKTLESHSNGN